MTYDEIAAELTRTEGRPYTAQQVRDIEAAAFRKLRMSVPAQKLARMFAEARGKDDMQ